jgi:hypothetical protein
MKNWGAPWFLREILAARDQRIESAFNRLKDFGRIRNALQMKGRLHAAFG